MAESLLEAGVGNVAVAAALAVFAFAAGRWGRRPALTHALWLLVLLKLVTPPVVDLPVRWLPATPAETAAAAALPEPTPALAVAAADPGPVVVECEPDAAACPPAKMLPAAEAMAQLTTPPTDAPSPPPAKPVEVPVPVFDLTQPAVAPEPVDLAGTESAAPPPAPSPPAAPEPVPADLGWVYPAVLVGWLVGSAVWVGLAAWRVWGFARVLRLADPAPAWLLAEADQVAAAVGLSRTPRLMLLPGAIAPMVWSLGRATVYFPAGLLGQLSRDQRSTLLAHEFAHLRRWDHFVRWLEAATLALYWWCPLAWWAKRELQRAEEECCDAWVVETLPAGNRSYATALLDTLDFLATAQPAPVLASGLGAADAVKRRLLLILDGTTPKRLPWAGRLAVAAAALMLLPLAPRLARLAAEQVPPPPAPAEQKPADPAAPEAPVGEFGPLGEPVLFEASARSFAPATTNWWSVAASADGKTIATCHQAAGTPPDGEIRLWDRQTMTVKRVIRAPAGVRTTAFSPDGTLLAAGGFDGSDQLYDTTTGRRWAFSAAGVHTRSVNWVTFIRNGAYLVSAGQDGTARVWDTAAVSTGMRGGTMARMSPAVVIEVDKEALATVACTPDGKTLITAGRETVLKTWDLPERLPKMGEPALTLREPTGTWKGHTLNVESVVVSPDGKLIASCSWDTKVRLWKPDGTFVKDLGGFSYGILGLSFSPDGKRLAAGAGTAGQGGQVKVWEIDTANPEATADGKLLKMPDAVRGIVFLADNKTVAAAGVERALHLIDASAESLAKKTHAESKKAVPAEQPIAAAVTSADGRYLATSFEDNSVVVWDMEAREVVRVLKGHGDIVSGLAFSPDNKLLATGSHDKTIRLWPLDSDGEPKLLEGHTSWVLGVAFSPDGRTLASGGYDKTVRLWDVKAGGSKVWKEHTAGVRAVAFSPNGKLLVSAGSDRVVRVWDVEAGTVRHALRGHKGAIRSAAFSPDGQTIATGAEDKAVKVWDVTAGKELHSLEANGDMVTAIRFSPGGATVAAATFNGQTVLWDPATGRLRQRLPGHQEAVTGVGFTANGRQLVTTGQDRKVRVWEPVTSVDTTALRVFRTGRVAVTTAAVSPDGRSAVTGGGQHGAVRFWDAGTGEPRQVVEAAHPGGVTALDWSADHKHALSAGADGKVKVWDAGSATLVREFAGRTAAFHPDGKAVAVADDSAVVLYDLATGDAGKKLAGHEKPVTRIAFAPMGGLMATAGQDRTVRLWDAATGQQKAATPPFKNYEEVVGLAFSPDGQSLAVAANAPDQSPVPDDTGEFQPLKGVWVFPTGGDAKSWATVPQPLNHGVVVTAVVWQPGGRGLVTATADGFVRVWDVALRRQVQQFRAHAAPVAAAAGRVDSRVLLTVGDDRSVKRWALPGTVDPPALARLTPPGGGKGWAVDFTADGKYLITAGGGDSAFRVYPAPLPSPSAVKLDKITSGTNASAFSPDGRTLATGHLDGSIVFWDVATGDITGRLTRHEKRVWNLAYSPDGATLLSVGGNFGRTNEAGEAFLWDVKSRSVRKELTGHTGAIYAAAFHPDGRTVATASADGTVRVWNADTGETTRTLTAHGNGGVRTLAYSADGARLVTGGYDNTVKVWADKDEPVRTIDLPEARPARVLFSPDGTEVVVCTRPNAQPTETTGQGTAQENAVVYVYKVDSPDAAPREFKGHAGATLNAVFLGDRQTLVTVGGPMNVSGEVKVWDFATGKVLGEFRGMRQWIETVAVAPDGRTIATGGPGGELRLWDAGGFRPIASAAHPGEKSYIAAAALSPDGKTYVTAGAHKSGLAVWDLSDVAKPVLRKRLLDHQADIRSVRFNPDGKRFVTSDDGGVVKVWDAATLEAKVSFRASELGIYRAVFTPDGKYLVTVAGRWQERKPGEIRVWDAESGQEAGRFPDQTREVWDVAFLDGGKTMVTCQAMTAAGDAHLKVWDFATKKAKPGPTVTDAGFGSRSLAVSPDGRFVALGSHNGKLKVFDAKTWREVADVPGLASENFRLAYTPDGNLLAVGSGEGGTAIVRMPTAEKK